MDFTELQKTPYWISEATAYQRAHSLQQDAFEKNQPEVSTYWHQQRQHSAMNLVEELVTHDLLELPAIIEDPYTLDLLDPRE